MRECVKPTTKFNFEVTLTGGILSSWQSKQTPVDFVIFECVPEDFSLLCRLFQKRRLLNGTLDM
jgi:hypothetical protein